MRGFSFCRCFMHSALAENHRPANKLSALCNFLKQPISFKKTEQGPKRFIPGPSLTESSRPQFHSLSHFLSDAFNARQRRVQFASPHSPSHGFNNRNKVGLVANADSRLALFQFNEFCAIADGKEDNCPSCPQTTTFFTRFCFSARPHYESGFRLRSPASASLASRPITFCTQPPRPALVSQEPSDAYDAHLTAGAPMGLRVARGSVQRPRYALGYASKNIFFQLCVFDT